jgi:hypothetical protein
MADPFPITRPEMIEAHLRALDRQIARRELSALPGVREVLWQSRELITHLARERQPNDLFSSIMTMLDPGTDETPADLLLMDMINRELERFAEELKPRISRPKGTA